MNTLGSSSSIDSIHSIKQEKRECITRYSESVSSFRVSHSVSVDGFLLLLSLVLVLLAVYGYKFNSTPLLNNPIMVSILPILGITVWVLYRQRQPEWIICPFGICNSNQPVNVATPVVVIETLSGRVVVGVGGTSVMVDPHGIHTALTLVDLIE